MSFEAEEKAFQAEVEAVKAWWAEDRWRQTRRPYTAESIVSKRGTLPIQYSSNAQSKKLWKILEARFTNGEVSATYGCLDPVMVTQMAKYLDTVYVSGWQCSSTASSTNEPSPDLADYPMVSFVLCGHFPLWEIREAASEAVDVPGTSAWFLVVLGVVGLSLAKLSIR